MVLRAPTEICSGSSNIWITRLEPKIFVSLCWEPKLHFVGVCGRPTKQIKKEFLYTQQLDTIYFGENESQDQRQNRWH